jgi:hypothetical protein
MGTMDQHIADAWPYLPMYSLTGLSSVSALCCYFQLNHNDIYSGMIVSASYNPYHSPQYAASGKLI